MKSKSQTFSSGPLCLVTGANTGIGFEVVRGLARAGCQVVLACRNQAKGEAARQAIAKETGNATLELLVVDLADQRSIRRAAQNFLEAHSDLDVLVNNAGIGSPERQVSVDAIELTFATNVIGYFLLTNLLLDALHRATAARIINVASKLAGGLDLNDVEFKSRPYSASAAYAQSKQANRMLTWALARLLKGTNVTANAMSPGPVDTSLLRTLAPGLKGRTTGEGADTVIWLATSPEVTNLTNRFWIDRREEPCQFRNVAQEEALWAICEGMTRKATSAVPA